MELVGTAINAAVVAAAALILGWLGKGRFDAVDQRIDRLEDRLDRGMDAMRSDLTQVALAVGVRPRVTKD